MRHVPAAILALLLVVSPASAEEGAFLRVGDCAAGSSVQSVTNDCTSNVGAAITLVVSCELARPYDQFVGAVAIFDIFSMSTTIPDWWRLDAAGCRHGDFGGTLAPGIAASCPSIWDDRIGMLPVAGCVVGLAGNYNIPLGHVRVTIGAAVPDAFTLNPVGAAQYSVARLDIARSRSTGVDACGGCGVATCIVLSDLLLQSLSPDFPIFRPGGFTHFMDAVVTYQMTDAPSCDRTPTRNRTWGALKSLYR